MGGSKAKIIIVCFLGLLCAGMLTRYLHRVPKRHYCDFRVYHHTAKVFLSGGEIYTDGTKEITPFKYSPFFAFLVSPLGLLPIKPAAALFFIVNFLAAIGLFWFSLKLCSDHSLTGRQTFLVTFLSVALVMRFIVQVWDSGQVPLILGSLALASLYFFSRGKDAAAGALLAGSILFKYLPAVFIPYFIARRRFKAAGLTMLFLVVWLVLPSLIAGFDRNFHYLSTWFPTIIRTSLDQVSYYDFKNQSFLSMVIRMTFPTPYLNNLLSLDFNTSLKLAYLLAAGLYMLVLVPIKGRDTSRLDFALLFTLIPLLNPNGWMVNFSVLVFPCVVLSAYLLKTGLRDNFVLTCLAASFVFTSLPNQEMVGNSLEDFFEMNSTVTLGTLFLVSALVKLKFSGGVGPATRPAVESNA